jgi:diadenosine tetraphosphate (Ap4A) HIT family hydrolase
MPKTKTVSTLIHERVELAKQGLSPQVIFRLRSGWAVLGDSQFIAGYSLLLPDPVVPSLNDLTPDQRAQFLLDMTAIGDALLATTDAYRINYEILGNSEPALHAHIFPRRTTEPEQYRFGPVFSYPKAERESRPFDPVREEVLRQGLRRFLETVGAAVSRGIRS